MVLGRMSGIPDKEIISGFNYSLFMILLGVTYLFSLAQLNGSLELLAKKVVALAGKHTFMIPIVIYVFSVVLSAIGPGTVPTMAIMMVFSMALAAEIGINPAMLSALTVLGASGGGVSPLAATGIIGINLCCLDVHIVACLMDICHNLITLSLTTASYHEVCKNVGILRNLECRHRSNASGANH